MTATPEVVPVTYRPAEAHAFQAGGSEFLYLVPSGAIFRMEGLPKAALDLVREREHTREEMIAAMLQQGFSAEEVVTALDELEQAEVLASNRSKPAVPEMPVQEFPLQRVVLNVTDQCNLACTYCYEYLRRRSRTAGSEHRGRHRLVSSFCRLSGRQIGAFE